MEKENISYECFSTVSTAEFTIPVKKISSWKIEAEAKRIFDETGCFIEMDISEVKAVRKQEDSKLPKNSSNGELSYKITAHCLEDKVCPETWTNTFLRLVNKLAKKTEMDLLAIIGKKAYWLRGK